VVALLVAGVRVAAGCGVATTTRVGTDGAVGAGRVVGMEGCVTATRVGGIGGAGVGIAVAGPVNAPLSISPPPPSTPHRQQASNSPATTATMATRSMGVRARFFSAAGTDSAVAG